MHIYIYVLISLLLLYIHISYIYIYRIYGANALPNIAEKRKHFSVRKTPTSPWTDLEWLDGRAGNRRASQWRWNPKARTRWCSLEQCEWKKSQPIIPWKILVFRTGFPGLLDDCNPQYMKLVGGFSPPLWKIWLRQLGLWHSQYMESHIKFHGSKPPTRYPLAH